MSDRLTTIIKKDNFKPKKNTLYRKCKYSDLDPEKLCIRYTYPYKKAGELKKGNAFIQSKNKLKLYNYCKNNLTEYYELLRSNIKAHFDVDKYLDLKKWKEPKHIFNEEKKILKKTVIDLIEVFESHCNEKIKTDDIKILRSSRKVKKNGIDKYKISFHIIGPNNLLFKSNNKINVLNEGKYKINSSPHLLALALVNKNEKFYGEMIDMNVYKSKQDMRMIYSTKGDGTCKLIPVDTDLNILDIPKEKYSDYIISYSSKNAKIKIFSDDNLNIYRSIQNKKTDEKNKKVIENGNYLKMHNNVDITTIGQLVSKKVKLYGNYKNFNKERNCFYFKKNKRCCISGRKECISDYCALVDGYKQVKLICMSKKCGKKGAFRNLGHINDQEAEFQNVIKTKVKFLLEMDKKTKKLILDFRETDDKKSDHYKIKKILNLFTEIENNQVLLIKSGVGSGKTALTELILKKLMDSIFKLLEKVLKNIKTKKDIRILFISYRRSLANYLTNKFKEYGFELYSDLQKNNKKFNSVNRLVVQLESLHKIFENSEEIDTYDIIIVDEIESLCAQINAPTVKYKEQTFKQMYSLFKASKKIIALDADISHRTKELFFDFNCLMIHNEYFTIKRKIEILWKPKYKIAVALREKQIIQDLSNGKKILIIDMSVNHVMALHTSLELQFPNKKGLDLTSRSDDKKLKLKTNEFKKYDWLIYTSILEAGVDINFNYYYRIYFFINGGGTHQRGSHQMVGRCRTVQNTTIRAVVNDKQLQRYSRAPLFSYSEIEKYFKYLKVFYKHHYKTIENKASSNSLFQKINDFNQTLQKTEIIDKKNRKIQYSYKMSKYNKITLHNLIEDFNKSSDVFLSKFYSDYDKWGMPVVDIYTTVDEEITETEEPDFTNILNLLKPIETETETETKNNEKKKSRELTFKFKNDKELFLLNNMITEREMNEIEENIKLSAGTVTTEDKNNIIFFNKFNRSLGLRTNLPKYFKKQKSKKKGVTTVKISFREQVYENLIKSKSDTHCINLKNYIHLEQKFPIYNENELYKIKKNGGDQSISPNYKKFNAITFNKYKYIKDILRFFNIDDITKINKDSFNRNQMGELMEKILTESLYYKNFKNAKKMFGQNRSKFPKTFKAFNTQIRALLKKYGLELYNLNKTSYAKKANYKIKINVNVAIVLRWKHEAEQKMNGYLLIEQHIKNLTDQNQIYLLGSKFTKRAINGRFTKNKTIQTSFLKDEDDEYDEFETDIDEVQAIINNDEDIYKPIKKIKEKNEIDEANDIQAKFLLNDDDYSEF